MTAGDGGMTRPGPDADDGGPDPVFVRAVLGLYPPRWRDRYGEEFAALLIDMAAASRWPARARLIANGAAGALAARLNHPGGSKMPDRIRGSIAVVACAVIAFSIAGAGFQKMTEYPDFQAVAHQHAAVAASFDILRVAAVLAGIAVLAGALPVAWSVIRQVIRSPRADLIRPLVVPPAVVLGWLIVVRVVVGVSRHPQVNSAANIATVTAVVLLSVAVAAACGWAAVTVLRRADLPAGLLRSEIVPMAVLTTCMAVVTGADISWGLALRSADGALFHSDNGLVATPVPPSWAGGVVVLLAVTVLTAVATVRAARELRTPAQPA
jgi:hypothetical protein